MSQIYFYLPSLITSDTIVSFCSEKLKTPISNFIVVENFIDFCINNEIDTTKIFVQYSIRTGQFDAWVEVYTKNGYYDNIENKVSFLIELSSYTQSQILTGDEDFDPYSFILIEPTGFCSTIDVQYNCYDQNDELNFGRYFNHVFGQFALKEEYNLQLLKEELDKLFIDNFDDFELQYGHFGPVVNGDFDKEKINFKSLKGFRFHYDIIPLNKQKWYSINEKSEILIKKMEIFSTTRNIDICIFPSDFKEVRNIEGGSDSEEYCIVYSRGKSEKIIYKNRRASWIKK